MSFKLIVVGEKLLNTLKGFFLKCGDEGASSNIMFDFVFNMGNFNASFLSRTSICITKKLKIREHNRLTNSHSIAFTIAETVPADNMGILGKSTSRNRFQRCLPLDFFPSS